MLISKVIPGLFGGVSQQPPALRLDNQCEAMENCFPSLAEGLQRRNPAEFVALLAAGTLPANTFTHFIDRDSNEQYIVFFTGDATTPIQIFDLSGTAKTVEYGTWDEENVFTTDATVKSYITSSSPNTELTALTIADYTIIVNKTIECKKSGVVDVHNPYPAGVIFVKSAVKDVTYNVYVDDVLQATISAGATPNSVTIATNLFNQLNTNLGALAQGFQVSRKDNVIVVWNEDGQDFSIRGSDTWSNSALTVLKERAKSVSELPPYLPPVDGYKTWAVDVNYAARGVTYRILIDAGEVASYTTPGGYWGGGATMQDIIDNLISDLAVSLPALDVDYRWMQSGPSTITIWRLDDIDITVTTESYYMQGEPPEQIYVNFITASYLGFSKAAPVMFIGGVDSESNAGYYVKWDETDSDTKSATGAWMETTKDNQDNNFDKTTLPHKLIRGADGIFKFGPIVWGPRVAGDDITAADPSFIDNTISDVFLFKGRLGFTSKDRLILSRAGGFFELYPHSALEVADDDPIDISPSTSDVAIMHWAVPYKGDILLMSDRDQFLVSSGDQLFGPRTVAVDHNTSFKCSTIARPMGCGANVYFVSPRGNYASLIEYFVQAASVTNDAADVSAHAPLYLPATVTKMMASPIFNTLLLIEQGSPDIYGYRFYWSGEQKAQSAWFRWTLPFNVMAAQLYGTYVYIIAQYEAQVFLVKINLESGHVSGVLDYMVHLDHLCYVATGTYDGGNNWTTFTLPYSDSNTTDYVMVRASDGTTMAATKISATQMRITGGDYSAVPMYMGRKYSSSFEFSEFGVKAPNTNIHNPQGRLQLKTLIVEYKDTGIFSLECTPKDRTAYTKDFTNVNIAGDAFGPPDISTGKARFFIMGRAKGMRLRLLNDTPYPSRFFEASWEGFYTGRSRSIG